ncbi:MAG: response regulator [Chloroflexota bacterium]|nr:response regulator [Chloroflexota bacterium]
MNKPHILIVDDDTALLQALPQAIQLRIDSIKVDTSDSALEALKLVSVNVYDAIVSDIKMPGMDGLALLTKIRELRPDTPTLLITGHGDHNLTIQALRGGAYDFIQKPIDRDYFVAALQRAIQTHQLRRQVGEQQIALEDHAKSLEQTVEERTRQLVEASAAKDEFLSIASHELKTPLASMKGMTQLLHRKLKRANAPEADDMERIEASIRRMELLVNDLLDSSLLETGMFVLHPKRQNLIEFCRQLIEEFLAGTHPATNVQLQVLNEPGETNEPMEVEIDVNRITQVITNLLSNARKYSPDGSPITVTVKRDGTNGCVSVRDRGIGIPREQLPHIFDRFYRVPGVEVQTGSGLGLGLGLYICQKIVERHKGKITVESSSEGSVFTVVLPLCAETVCNSSQETEPTQVL